jgi:hypothetical protein
MKDRFDMELSVLVRPPFETDKERRLDREATQLTAPLRVIRQRPESYRSLWTQNRDTLARGVRP